MHTVREKSVKILLLIAILLVSGFTIAIILFGINQFKFGSQLASINQVSNLSHILVRQQANLFSSLLNNNVSAEKLADQLTALSREKFVLDASVYSGNGELLAQTQQIVEPIFDGNSVIGFLRVTFDVQYGQTSESKINQQFRYLYAEVIVVLLVGALIASSLHYFFRRRKIKLVPMRTLRKNQENQQRSKAFHQQRRRFKR